VSRPELMALLADVKENPADLTPWLVLTDWLEENGDESDRARAEYCRLCFDKLGKQTFASDWEKGERRRELFREWNKEWLGVLADCPPPTRCQTRRGLLAVETNASGLLTLHRQGIGEERWEWVEELNVTCLEPTDVVRLAECPLVRGPSILKLGLYWSRWMGKGVIASLANSPYLSRVHQLHLLGQAIPSNHPEKLEKMFAPLRRRLGEALKL
jgi:uncharacterized protein (TIGR02996 family)